MGFIRTGGIVTMGVVSRPGNIKKEHTVHRVRDSMLDGASKGKWLPFKT